MKKTLVEIVTALALVGGVEHALAQRVISLPIGGAAVGGVNGINSFNEGYLIDGNNYSIDDLCLLNPMACDSHSQIIDENNPSYPGRNTPITPLEIWIREMDKLIEVYSKNNSAEERITLKPRHKHPKDTTLSSDSSDTEKELGSVVRIDSTSTAVTSPASLSTNKDPCPENLSLEQLRSYQLIEKRPPIEQYLNKSGCIGSIVYNSAEERIIYHTSNNQLSTLTNITDTAGKTIYNGNLAGAVDAMEVTTTPSAGLFEYLPSFNGCASNMTISTSMGIGLAMGTLIISTPLVYLAVRHRRKVRMESTVYTSTRMGV